MRVPGKRYLRTQKYIDIHINYLRSSALIKILQNIHGKTAFLILVRFIQTITKHIKIP